MRPDPGGSAERLTAAVAERFADLALANVRRAYPTKLDHILNGPEDVRPPSVLHPAFWGSFDWHSCVHAHWMLARLLCRFPASTFASRIRAHFDARLTPSSIAGEIAYLDQPNRGSFVRTYGWAWLLKLADELDRGVCEEASASVGREASLCAESRPSHPGHFARWQAALAPLAARFVASYREYLPRARVPLRYGLHPNSAFGLGFAIDHATRAHDDALRALAAGKALDWYARDVDYAAHLEPSGSDFLSPALVEADLMRRVLDRAAFAAWLERFLPRLEHGQPESLFTPVEAGDHADPQMVHLDGLNLSRAWCFAGIATALDATDPRRTVLRTAAERHLDAGLPTVMSGDYMGEHWLATFAVHALTSRD